MGKKDSLSDVPSTAFDFKNMSGYRSSVCASEAMSPGIEGGEAGQDKGEGDLLSLSSTFKLCQRSQFRRNTDFSNVSQDLKKFLADRESKRRDSDQDILDILPPPSYK